MRPFIYSVLFFCFPTAFGGQLSVNLGGTTLCVDSVKLPLAPHRLQNANFGKNFYSASVEMSKQSVVLPYSAIYRDVFEGALVWRFLVVKANTPHLIFSPRQSIPFEVFYWPAREKLLGVSFSGLGDYANRLRLTELDGIRRGSCSTNSVLDCQLAIMDHGLLLRTDRDSNFIFYDWGPSDCLSVTNSKPIIKLTGSLFKPQDGSSDGRMDVLTSLGVMPIFRSSEADLTKIILSSGLEFDNVRCGMAVVKSTIVFLCVNKDKNSVSSFTLSIGNDSILTLKLFRENRWSRPRLDLRRYPDARGLVDMNYITSSDAILAVREGEVLVGKVEDCGFSMQGNWHGRRMSKSVELK